MFGLEDQKNKKKKAEEFIFDLEKDFKNSKTKQKHLDHIEKQINAIKKILRAGEEKEEFDALGSLLHGYTSAVKVIARFSNK